MKNFIILSPTYNDWESLDKLLFEINKRIQELSGIFKILIINDFSEKQHSIKLKRLKNISDIKILNLKKNIGSQKAICLGLKYLYKFKKDSIIVVIDSDGEDDPSKIKEIINLSIKNKDSVVTVNRLSRRESLFLRSLNKLRLIFTYIFTGKYINFGNYSAFHSKNLKKILSNSRLWLAYSGGIAKNCPKIKSLYVKKKKRFLGKSKVSFLFLLKHSINIILVFKKELLIRSILFFLLINLFLPIAAIKPIFYLICLMLILILLYEKKNDDEYKKCLSLIKKIENIKN